MAKYSSGLEDNLELADSSITALEGRYLKKDEKGRVLETATDMYRRVARNIASAEAFYLKGLKDKVTKEMPFSERYEIIGEDARVKEFEEDLFGVMYNGEFLFNSPTLMNAGGDLQQLAACFVLPVGDSMEEIFDSLKWTAMVHKSGGGTGFSFSRLRSKDSYVGTTGGVASGPISFMKIFNSATEQVKQGGTRRGANMGILNVDHPDILDFIYAKEKDGELNNFNLSVGVTDEFMNAVREGRNYNLINPKDGSVAGELDARNVYEKLVVQAHHNGDPGVVFIDKMNKDNPTPKVGKIESTNPCGEQPLLPMEACNLGSINLGKVVTKNGDTDWNNLERIVRIATRSLDNAIEVGKYPLPQIEKMVLANRKIGLGVMGFSDYLARKKISYQSKKALIEAKKVMKFINKTSIDESEKLAQERGAFPNFDESIYAEQNLPPRRNATLTTIAPTGTLSVIANASSGIEPLFAPVFNRNVGDSLGKDLIEVNPTFEEYLKEKDLYSKELLMAIAKDPHLKNTFLPEKIKNEIKELFPTAHDVAPEWHVRMQAAFQKYVHNAVSKTVNLTKDATVEDVRRIYDLAYELDCKGITIYRDGSKEKQILTTGEKEDGTKASLENLIRIPNIISALKVKQATPKGNMHVNMSIDPKRNYDVVEAFGTIGNAGGEIAASLEAIGRLSSEHLRGGGSSLGLIKKLKDIGSKDSSITNSGLVSSIPQGFSRALMKYELARRTHPIKDILLGRVDFDELDEEVSGIIRGDNFEEYLKENERKSLNGKGKKTPKDVCPDCGDKLRPEEGCMKCTCGFSKCG
ncbi:MAG: vitamin B12-dependent ribonucleotide reductase [Candidatus Pacearchaeota archaeon]|jgi:ribonucleoside-diphosphate reductase alpha chain